MGLMGALGIAVAIALACLAAVIFLCVARRTRSLGEAPWTAEDRLRALLGNHPAPAWLKDPVGRYVFVNVPFMTRVGLRKSDVLGKTDFDLWEPEVAKRLRENDLEALKAGAMAEVREPAPDATDALSRSWGTVRFRILDGSREKLIGGMSIDQPGDKAEEALMEVRRFVRGLLQSEALLVLILDCDGRIVRCNLACEHATERPRSEIENKLFWEVMVPPEEREAAKAVFDRLLERRAVPPRVWKLSVRQGRSPTIAWTCSQYVTEDAQVRYMVASGVDVTGRIPSDEFFKVT